MKIKVIAHTSTDTYGWKVLVELDRRTIGTLISEYGPRLPNVGSELDMSKTFERLIKLEDRERKVKEFRELLGAIAEPEVKE